MGMTAEVLNFRWEGAVVALVAGTLHEPSQGQRGQVVLGRGLTTRKTLTALQGLKPGDAALLLEEGMWGSRV